MTSFDLRGRTALVTGGFSGLGRHFADVLAAHGARVALLGRRIELGRQVAAEIGTAAGRPADIRAYEADVTDVESVRHAFTQVITDVGLPTVVVNNAGTVARAPSVELADQEWRGVVDVNLSGVFRVAQAAAREMIRAGQPGSIINIASILGPSWACAFGRRWRRTRQPRPRWFN
jgi:NAD(P)-dependent dehydrogenase (short-subunit alcohol dehydrogenase family)